VQFRFVPVAIILIVATVTSCKQVGGGSLAPGNKAPDLDFVTFDNEPAKLSDFRGKVVLLHFLASWCAPCIEEVPALNALHQQMEGEDFVLLAIGTEDNLDDLQSFVSDNGVRFPVYFDKSNLVRHRYKVTGFPESFLLDKAGNLVLMVDPHNNNPTIRLTGPQNWGSPAMKQALKKLLKE